MGMIMIDKHFPSLLSLKACACLFNRPFLALTERLTAVLKKHNLTGVYIRLCQFHVVQAISRWEWGQGRKGLSVVIPKPIKYQIVYLFRFIQRARTREEFDALAETFIEQVERLIMDDEVDQEDSSDDEAAAEATQKFKKSKGKGLEKGQRRGKQKSLEVRRAMFAAVEEYFRKHWFVDAWIGELRN